MTIMWEVNDEPAPLWHHAQPQKPRPAKPVPPSPDLSMWTNQDDDDPGSFDNVPNDDGSAVPGALYVLACAGAVICGLGAAGAYTVGGAGWGWWLAGFAGFVAFLVCANAKEGI